MEMPISKHKASNPNKALNLAIKPETCLYEIHM